MIIWPPEDYLNVWVTEIEQEFLGYAQFPTSDMLGGLAAASSNEATDGIVIHYRAFGSIATFPAADLFSQYQLGRTATHEVGHYLGLRHIWGDNSSCSVDDFVSDTPPATRSNNGLGSPCSFPGANTCTTDSPDQPDMFQNYMDFSDDICMNLFTEGQKDRIRTVLDNSPRRLSLSTSKGALAPVIVNNDMGIRNILTPNRTSCESVISPRLEVRNYGNNSVTSFTVQVLLNGNPMLAENFNVNLASLEIDEITLSPITLNETITNDLSFIITSTNGSMDENGDNDNASISVDIPANGNIPFSINFDVFPNGWSIDNMDETITWQLQNAPKDIATNQALGIDFFDYEIEGELDLLQSPLLDLSGADDAILSFDVAYASFSGVTQEGLFVTITRECEDPVYEADTVFFELANDLETANTNRSFIPSGQQDWKTEVINLRDYLGEENIRISFIAQNAFGNNLYLDNIELDVTARPDIAVEGIVSPSVVSCQPDQPLTVQFRNTGTLSLGYFEINYRLNNESTRTQIVELTDSLELNEALSLDLPVSNFSDGENELLITVSAPNQMQDVNADNNSVSLNFLIDDTTDIIPLKEQFNNFSEINWSVGNPDNDLTWESARTSMGTSAFVNLNNYTALGEQDWLVSPIIDLTDANQATFNFDVAYSFENGQNDELAVLISTDCGSTYFVSDFQRSGSNLQTGTFSGNPETNDLWQNISITLNEFLGEENVRIAFVSTNANGNDIFIDNIQVFVTDFFIGANSDLFPNPTVNGRFSLLFELDERETVDIKLYDVRGNTLQEQSLPNTLNQTYEVDMSSLPQGIYLVRVKGESFSYVRRVMHAQ